MKRFWNQLQQVEYQRQWHNDGPHSFFPKGENIVLQEVSIKGDRKLYIAARKVQSSVASPD